MPTYTKTTWVNGSVPAVSATNLNKIETGIDTATPMTGQTSISNASQGWVSTTVSGYTWQRDFSISGVTTNFSPIVLFLSTSLQISKDNNISFAQTYNGGIRLFSSSIPTSTGTFSFEYILINCGTTSITGTTNSGGGTITAREGAKNVWVQQNAPTALSVGDIWFDT